MRCRWSPRSWDAVIAREELRVDAEVAAWLVPDDELWLIVDDIVAGDQEPTTKMIAEEFQVTRPIARIALDRHARVRGITLLAG
jgi:hypothetical protein